MRLLFLGSLYPEHTFERLVRNQVNVGFAAQVFQKALLSGLDALAEVNVISEVTIPSFPNVNQLWVKRELFSHNMSKRSDDETVSYLNLPFLKHISVFGSYVRAVRRKKSDVILIYEVTSRHLLSSIIGGRGVKKVLIVPDLPEFMSENKNIFYLLLKKIDRWIINKAIKHIDGFVLFSKYMAESLNIGEKPYIVVEGIYNSQEENFVQKSEKKVILYTGKIEKWFGLYDLLSAFCKITGENYELWLCGNGDQAMINSFTNKDSRIKYLGVMPHYDVLNLQKQATILVNPRHSADEFTKFSFPSKTMEYMASGTPTLMCRLKSIPEEYNKHLFFFDDESIEGMANTIKECLDMPTNDLLVKGSNAAAFIKKHKSSSIQGQRIVEFISKLINDLH